MRQLLREEAIGPLRLIRVNFGLNAVDLRSNPCGAPNVRLVPSLGGGALLDLGSYAVSLARIAAGVRPLRVHAAGIDVYKRQSLVDVQDDTVYIRLEGGNGFLAEANSFARLVANGPNEWSGATPVESVDVMLTLDAIRKSTQSGVWEEVGS